jgi:hypothetical protein
MFDAGSAFAAIGQKGAFKINNNNIWTINKLN